MLLECDDRSTQSRSADQAALLDPERVSPPSGSTTGSGRSTLSLSPIRYRGVVGLDAVRSTIRPLDDDLADLDHRSDVGVVGDVGPDLGAVLLRGGLVALDRITD